MLLIKGFNALTTEFSLSLFLTFDYVEKRVCLIAKPQSGWKTIIVYEKMGKKKFVIVNW